MNNNQIFGILSQGKKIPLIKVKSKTLGNLLQDGLIVEWGKPFSVLNMLKAQKYAHIFPKKRMRVVAVREG
jgi:hypothetical protein